MLGGLIGNRNFLLLWGGALIVSVGDAFSFVAFPWLVIKLSDSAFALGAVVAVEAVPRALFMLIGGAITDRLSPRLVIVYARLGFAVMVLALVALILTGEIRLWMVFLFAFAVGSISAFSIPAMPAILPQMVPISSLPLANSVMSGTNIMSFLMGPALAGVLLVFLSGGDAKQLELAALGYVFLINAVAMLLASGVVAMIRVEAPRGVRDKESVAGAVVSGILYLWDDRDQFLMFLYAAVISMLFFGLALVGFPMLAKEALGGGALDHGFMLSAFGGGMLVGILLAGVLPEPRHFSTTLFAIGIFGGLGYALIGQASSTFSAVVLIALVSQLSGYTQISLVTWFQKRVAPAVMGRIMSLLMFGILGLGPIGGIWTGYLIEAMGVREVFMLTGCVGALFALACLLHPRMRGVSSLLAPEHRRKQDQ